MFEIVPLDRLVAIILFVLGVILNLIHNFRRESKLSVPDMNEETLVSTTPVINEDSMAIRHIPQVKRGLKALLTTERVEDH